MKLILTSAFASNAGVKNGDTHAMKRTLNRLGYYTPADDIGLNDIPDRAVFQSLSAFQQDQGLKATGAAKPDDGTVAALNAAQDSKDAPQSYQWNTVGDDKVRPEHAALAGQIFQWG